MPVSVIQLVVRLIDEYLVTTSHADEDVVRAELAHFEAGVQSGTAPSDQRLHAVGPVAVVGVGFDPQLDRARGTAKGTDAGALAM